MKKTAPRQDSRSPDQGQATAAQGESKSEGAPLKPGLYVVATPIGNLGDITRRAIDILGRADLVACEDTRVTGRLLQLLGLSARMLPYHEHNADGMRPKLLAALAKGQSVALVSDAGTPLVSDPGYRLVRMAEAAGHPVTAVPGPSAVLAALCLAGLPTDRFFFAGFLPPKSAARRRALQEVAAVPGTLVFFETAPRLADSLADMLAVLGPREAAVARELTKLHEEVRRAPLDLLTAEFAARETLRGELVVVVGPPQASAATADDAAVDRLLADALPRMSLADAADAVAAATGRRRKDVYARALALKSAR